ncbi:hypothetical protein GWK91_08765 [Virgibacillus sp. MSP4-1]|uniref:hypothetical protein n=1 Tax=Virgibacillus sp. MSP4-1 TaxID=2700081 RepID=UPI00039FE50F|nr:hypothetical protein [Virgibacillus sp. MSP4-1]QHS23036.1 hypothetical protein GWK91_08765 [Virgibacillus sp. MSP4-1]
MKKNIIVLLVVTAFSFTVYITTNKMNENESAQNEKKVSVESHLEDLKDYKKNVLQSTVRKEFESLFNIDMKDFKYSDIGNTFPGEFVAEASSLSSDVGDYYPLGFTKGDKGYILLLEHDGTYRIWTLHKENEEWVLKNKEKKQGTYIDNKKIMDRAEQEFLEKHPEVSPAELFIS